MVLRVNKHNFCFVVIEFQLVYVHRMTYISDTVLYAQPCNIDTTILERYLELSIISIEMINDTMTLYYLGNIKLRSASQIRMKPLQNSSSDAKRVLQTRK